MEYTMIAAFLCGALTSTIAYRLGVSDKAKVAKGETIKVMPKLAGKAPKEPEKDKVTEGFEALMSYTGEEQKEAK